MNMTPDEQRALVQFFGTVHAQAKQTDQMIVGNSQFVKPVSPNIQRELEQALRIPVQSEQPQHQPPQYVEPSHQYVEPVIGVEQAVQELSQLEQRHIEQPVYQATSQPVQTTPVVSNVDIISVLQEINLNLARIGDILEKKNGPSKRTKATKSD